MTLIQMTATELKAAIEQGQTSCVEITRAYLDEIGAGPPGYIPFLTKVGVNWHLGN